MPNARFQMTVSLHSYARPESWECFDALPIAIQEQADRRYALFAANPYHPSLHFKEAGPYWSVRVSRGYRALARRRGNDLYWFWIGGHTEYERLLNP